MTMYFSLCACVCVCISGIASPTGKFVSTPVIEANGSPILKFIVMQIYMCKAFRFWKLANFVAHGHFGKS